MFNQHFYTFRTFRWFYQNCKGIEMNLVCFGFGTSGSNSPSAPGIAIVYYFYHNLMI